MRFTNYETGLDYANTDPSLHYNTIDPSGPDWRNEYLRLIMDRDYEAAHELRKKNDPRYAAESEPQVTVIKFESEPLQSCSHKQIEEVEREVA